MGEQGATVPQDSRKASGLARATFWLGLASILFTILTAIPALIMGIKVLRRAASSGKDRKLAGVGMVLAVVLSAGMLTFVVLSMKAELAEAHRLYEAGQVDEAIVAYKRLYDRGNLGAAKDAKLMSRLVDYEGKAGKKAEAKRYVIEALDGGVTLSPETEYGKAVVTQVKAEREEARHKAEAARTERELFKAQRTRFFEIGKKRIKTRLNTESIIRRGRVTEAHKALCRRQVVEGFIEGLDRDEEMKNAPPPAKDWFIEGVDAGLE